MKLGETLIICDGKGMDYHCTSSSFVLRIPEEINIPFGFIWFAISSESWIMTGAKILATM